MEQKTCVWEQEILEGLSEAEKSLVAATFNFLNARHGFLQWARHLDNLSSIDDRETALLIARTTAQRIADLWNAEMGLALEGMRPADKKLLAEKEETRNE